MVVDVALRARVLAPYVSWYAGPVTITWRARGQDVNWHAEQPTTIE
jgi:hypothetical protein